MLTRLIYASEATDALTPASVQGIVDRARTANERGHLTGMLAFDSRCFLQALEGRREAVSATFCRIAADPRHRRVVLLEALTVDERLFDTWSMGFAPADARGRGLCLRFGGTGTFQPHDMSAPAALGLLRALAAA